MLCFVFLRDFGTTKIFLQAMVMPTSNMPGKISMEFKQGEDLVLRRRETYSLYYRLTEGEKEREWERKSDEGQSERWREVERKEDIERRRERESSQRKRERERKRERKR